MELPSQSQVLAAGRHVVSYSMGAVTALAAVHLISSGDATTIANSINQISQGMALIFAGLGPIIALASGWWATYTSSSKVQIATVKAMPGVEVVKEGSGGTPISVQPKEE